MNSAKWQIIKALTDRALNLPFVERADFLARETDEEIRLEAIELLAAIESSKDFINQPYLIEEGFADDPETDRLTGEKVGNYLLHQRIGTGGMGAVYLAERLNSDFKQKVALKLIKRGMDSEQILNRFSRERRILSTLRHPNIAQLLDGGSSGEGLPFFVMEYVAGRPLNEFCDERNSSIEERLRIFRQICAAVEHAHKNLIVHRDLKPSNILVTADGTPKLLDFGIAKLLSDEEAEITQTQNKVLTPEYAAPEQILGKAVTTAADIYSLGVILYQLLSGARPFDLKGKSFEEIVRSVCETEPERPSSVVGARFRAAHFDSENQTSADDARNTAEEEQIRNPQSAIRNPRLLQGDLDNIVLKSLHKEPSERYATVLQFSEDIERYLNGLPVAARAQTLNYRFGKYIRRHKVGAAAAALVFLSLIGGISVATWQAVLARRERARAEQNFNDVRKLANSVVFELQDAIQNLPGSTPARELLIRRALEYLDKLADQETNDISLQNELADAYDKIARIQGGFATSQLGNREKAEENYRKALALREKMVAAEPENLTYRRNLAWSYYNLGTMFLTRVNVPESLKMYQTADEIMQNVLQKAPDDPKMKATYGRILIQKGFLTCADGEYDECLRILENAVDLWEKVTAENPEKDNLISFGSALEVYADATAEIKKDYDGALKINARSLEISQRVLAEDPDNPESRRNVGIGFHDVAKNYKSGEDYQKALENAQKAREIFTKLISEDPENVEFKQNEATNETLISELLIKSGKADEAIRALNKSLTALEQQIKDSPTDKIGLFRLSTIYRQLGYGYRSLGEKDSPDSGNRKRACEYFQKSYSTGKEFIGNGIPTGTEDEVAFNAVTEELKKCGGADR